MLGDTGQPPPGGGDKDGKEGDKPLESPSHVRPGQTFADAAQAASPVPGGRSWQQIVSDAREKRNILELHLTKITQKDDKNQTYQPKHLTHDDLSDFCSKS